MAYASDRTYLDADSHLMELPDFLQSHAEADMRGRLPQIEFSSAGESVNNFEAAGGSRSHTPETVADLVALGDDLIRGPKGVPGVGSVQRGRAHYCT